MKRFIGVLAIAAIAATALFATVAGAATYDNAGIGSVSKGDVQTLLGWNDATLQANAGNLKFTGKLVLANETNWNCSDGSIQHQTSAVTESQPLKVNALTNGQGKITSGWTLNGIDSTAPMTYVSGERTGAPYVGYCPAGSGFAGFNPNIFTTTYLPGMNVNGIALPNTPAV